MEDEINKIAWDNEVKKNNYWTRVCSKEDILQAKCGILRLPFLPSSYLKESWIDYLGDKVLALAAGGGQQAPLLSAYNKDVTLLDISPLQLRQDEYVKNRDSLSFDIIQGSMLDRFPFQDGSFDSIINPTSINFIKDVRFTFKEVYRVLKKGGAFMLAFANPALYMFDVDKLERGKMKIKYTLPFSSEASLSKRDVEKRVKNHETFEYSHTLNSIFTSLLELGFVIKDFDSSTSDFEPIDSFLKDCYLGLLLIKA